MPDAIRHQHMYSIRHGAHGGIQVLQLGYLDGVEGSSLELWRSNVDGIMVFVLESGAPKPIFAFAPTDEKEFHQLQPYTLWLPFANVIPQWFPCYVRNLEIMFGNACALMDNYRPVLSIAEGANVSTIAATEDALRSNPPQALSLSAVTAVQIEPVAPSEHALPRQEPVQEHNRILHPQEAEAASARLLTFLVTLGVSSPLIRPTLHSTVATGTTQPRVAPAVPAISFNRS
jgi:hypothetical protein